MSFWADQLILLPILLPLLFAAALVLLSGRRQQLKFAINLIGTLALLATAITLFWFTDREVWPQGVGVYLAANWAAPFGIALVVDRLSALMLTLCAVIALAALVFSYRRWSRAGVHFHSLFQFLLAGINGSFITGDLFNLFVFFEIMLAASYGLLLHGSGTVRVKAGLHYIAINLVASSLFLIGVALMYSAIGTLNMAHMADKMATLGTAHRQLFETGAAVLAVALLIKSAVWPLNFWLPGSYGAAVAPVSAVFAIMTKVGFYVLLRLWLLIFGDEAGASQGFGAHWLMLLGLATLGYAAFGMLSAVNFKTFAGFSVIASSGTLLTALSLGGSAGTAAALYYLLGSTLAIAAFYLLVDVLERIHNPCDEQQTVTLESFEAEGMILPEDSEIGVAIPRAMAVLSLSFLLCLLVLTGLPPLSGFIGKFALMVAVLGEETQGMALYGGAAFIVLLIVSGLAATITLMRLGIQWFWVPEEQQSPRLRLIEAGPVAGLLLLVISLTIAAGPILAYLQRTAQALHAPAAYIDGVLGAEARPHASQEAH